MSNVRKTSRKLSTDVHRKLSAISNCSNVSDISVRFGMDPNDFRSTISDILGEKVLCDERKRWIFLHR